jgi:hypothetical protein
VYLLHHDFHGIASLFTFNHYPAENKEMQKITFRESIPLAHPQRWSQTVFVVVVYLSAKKQRCICCMKHVQFLRTQEKKKAHTHTTPSLCSLLMSRRFCSHCQTISSLSLHHRCSNGPSCQKCLAAQTEPKASGREIGLLCNRCLLSVRGFLCVFVLPLIMNPQFRNCILFRKATIQHPVTREEGRQSALPHHKTKKPQRDTVALFKRREIRSLLYEIKMRSSQLSLLVHSKCSHLSHKI